MVAISIHHFSKIFCNGVTAAKDVRLEIKAGSLFGLLGPNGAGKSTLIAYIAGLLVPTTGCLRIFGKPVQNRRSDHLRKMGFVLEKPVYLEKLKVEEYLRFAGCLYRIEKKDIRDRIDVLLSLFDMETSRNTLIETLSSGLKKRISLMSALIHGPDILVLDEPFEGMDPIAQNRIGSLLSLMVKHGKTVLYATHHLHKAETLCDEIAIMDQGRIKYHCTLDTLLQTQRSRDNRLCGQLEGLFSRVIPNEENFDGLNWML